MRQGIDAFGFRTVSGNCDAKMPARDLLVGFLVRSQGVHEKSAAVRIFQHDVIVMNVAEEPALQDRNSSIPSSLSEWICCSAIGLLTLSNQFVTESLGCLEIELANFGSEDGADCEKTDNEKSSGHFFSLCPAASSSAFVNL